MWPARLLHAVSAQAQQPAGPEAQDSALTLLYRGSLSSCNYTCQYCPFAKRRDSRKTLARDAQEVARFLAWCTAQQRPLKIFFTPWGEALVRQHYRQTMLALAALPHVQQVAIQTNLAGPLSWLGNAAPGKIALWCTYHPSQTSLPRFLARCERLREMAVPFSVGVVALREHFAQIRALRAALPAKVYLWLNAFDRRGPGYYSDSDLLWLDALDPWFVYNRKPVPARGKPCRAGQETIAVEGDGTVTRCHFVPQVLGNLYTGHLSDMLAERPCPKPKCDCFIGYVQRRDLPLHQAFGAGVLPRILPP